MTSLPLVFEAPKRGLPPRHLADLDTVERRAAVVELGEKAFRAEQLSRHYFAGGTLAGATALSEASRAALAPLWPELLTVAREVDCDDGATRKTVWRGQDGTLVESVLMRYTDRTTVCVSSQAGCGMACPFCATGQAGLTRNLSTAEIVEQVVRAGEPVSNVVFMGMGVTEWATSTTPAASSVTCGHAEYAWSGARSAGGPVGSMGRPLTVHRPRRVVTLAGAQRHESGRTQRCRTTTRRACS